MANALYPKFKQSLLDKLHDLNTDDIRVILADLADYTYSAAHDFVDDVTAPARVATLGAAVGSPTITDGVFDHADYAFTLVTGDQSEALIYYNHGQAGADTGRGLICFFDTGVTGFPVTPGGGNINVTVHASGVFAL